MVLPSAFRSERKDLHVEKSLFGTLQELLNFLGWIVTNSLIVFLMIFMKNLKMKMS